MFSSNRMTCEWLHSKSIINRFSCVLINPTRNVIYQINSSSRFLSIFLVHLSVTPTMKHRQSRLITWIRFISIIAQLGSHLVSNATIIIIAIHQITQHVQKNFKNMMKVLIISYSLVDQLGYNIINPFSMNTKQQQEITNNALWINSNSKHIATSTKLIVQNINLNCFQRLLF